MLPVLYDKDAERVAASKFKAHGDYYANIQFYHFRTNFVRTLFPENTFIRGFGREYSHGYGSYYRYAQTNRNSCISRRSIFYFVKDDFDKNGQIDDDDPSVLYVSDKNGYNLRALTPKSENAVSIDVFDKEGFALIKMQRDVDQNGRFDRDDKDYYFVRLDLRLLTLSKRIELD
jgi:hypothetical protein